MTTTPLPHKPKTQVGLVHGLTSLARAVIASVAGVFLAVVIITTYLSATGQLNPSYSPIEYTAGVMNASNVPVCPGSILKFRPSYRSLYAPARVPLYSQLRNLKTNEKIRLVSDGLPIDNYMVIDEDVGQVKSEPVTFALPFDTRPGNYVWIGYAQTGNKLPASIRAVFTVKDCR